MVVLDDLHWADAMAVWVLEQLPRALGDAAVAVVATSREREPEMPRLDGVQRVSRSIRLERLDVAAVGRLAEAAATATSRPVDASCTPGPVATRCSFVLSEKNDTQTASAVAATARFAASNS